jgi:hypothetical protein
MLVLQLSLAQNLKKKIETVQNRSKKLEKILNQNLLFNSFFFLKKLLLSLAMSWLFF